MRLSSFVIPAYLVEVFSNKKVSKKACDIDREERDAIIKSGAGPENKELDKLLDGWKPKLNKCA